LRRNSPISCSNKTEQWKPDHKIIGQEWMPVFQERGAVAPIPEDDKWPLMIEEAGVRTKPCLYEWEVVEKSVGGSRVAARTNVSVQYPR